MARYQNRLHKRAARIAIERETTLKAFRGFLRQGDTSGALDMLDKLAESIADMRAQVIGFEDHDDAAKSRGFI